MYDDPLQADCLLAAVQSTFDDSDWENDPVHEEMPHLEKRRAVLQWSCERVKMWLLQNVPFRHHRMQECLHAFDTQAVDGLCLLTLRKSHRACLGMNDFEWLLFKAARRRLLSATKKNDHLSMEQLDSTRNMVAVQTPPLTPTKDQDRTQTSSPESPFSLRSRSSPASNRLGSENSSTNSRLTLSSDGNKNEQMEVLVAEVQSLRGEIVRAEERQSTTDAQMHHIDYVLRTATLTGYMYTRTRWIPLLGDPMAEDVDADDWLQRFLVLQGSSIFFYLCSTDLRPQGTILLEDIVEAGLIPPQMQNEHDWCHSFVFHITTCHGLRLECATQSMLQVHSWLSLLGVEMKFVQQEQRTNVF